VLTLSETSGTFRGKEVSSRNAETLFLEKRADGWRIVHIHWSSRRKEAPKP
jgi:ketosteroid isomerase-like protein